MADTKAVKYVDGKNVHDLMPLYYGRLFPVQEMYKWLAYGNDQKHKFSDHGYFQVQKKKIYI